MTLRPDEDAGLASMWGDAPAVRQKLAFGDDRLRQRKELEAHDWIGDNGLVSDDVDAAERISRTAIV